MPAKQFLIEIEDQTISTAESEITIHPMIVPLEDHGLPFSDLIEKHKADLGEKGDVTVYGIVAYSTKFKAVAPPKAA